MPRLSTSRAGILSFSLAAACVFTGCSTAPHRKVCTDKEFTARAAANAEGGVATLAEANEKLVALLWKERERLGPDGQVTMNFLALSGGGDYGAFGAGLLVGWGQVADPAHRRPNFDVVTGVSTGALLAPFAYVGTDEACERVEHFYRNPQPDWVEERGLFFFLPDNPSFMIIPKLEDALDSAVSHDMIQQMAAKARDGRVLAISATDLDFGTQHIWNLGVEAEKAEDSGHAERVRKIMLASSAIPVAFPPIEIDGSLYADGGVTANVLVKLDPRSPGSFIQTWKREHPDVPIPRIRYWLIFNNSLHQPPKTVQAKWPSVLSPALATSIRSATISEMRWLASQADYVNCAYGTDIEVRMISIPDEWRPPVEGDFKKPTMDSLADLGRKLGADPASWTLMTTPRDAKR